MNERCNCKNRHGYKWYGARGIKNEWLLFEQFKNDMYKDYLNHTLKFGVDNTSIDRINPDGNYCEENCRWATRTIQRNNYRNMQRYKGKTIRMWAKELNVNEKTLYNRMHMGWSIRKTIIAPVKKGGGRWAKKDFLFS